MSAPSYQIRPHSPWRGRALFLLALLVAVACAWGGYEYGRYSSGYDVREARRLRNEQRTRIAELEGRNRQLIKQNADLELSAQIDRDAHADVSASLSQLQQSMLEAREELAFYRSIVAPGELADGLHVQRFRLSPGEAGQYSYELVLTQSKRKRKEARGQIDLRVSGQLDDRSVTYALTDLAEGDLDKLQFKFKYFQSFEGGLRLPSGYRPQSVTIIVQPKGGKLKTVRKTFQWPEVISGGN